MGKNQKEKKSNIYIIAAYANSAYINSKFVETIKVAKETINLNKEYLDMYYLIGFSEKHMGNKEKAFIYLSQYIDLLNRYNKLEISKNPSIAMYYLEEKFISNAYFEICQYQLINEEYIDAYKSYINIKIINQKISCGINILIEMKKYQELYELYSSCVDKQQREIFITIMEDKFQRIKIEDKVEIYIQFSADDDLYGLLCKERLSSDHYEKLELTKSIIDKLDFNKQSLFYSEILYNFKNDIEIIIDSLTKVETIKLKSIFNLLIEKDENIITAFEDYIMKVEEKLTELNKLRIIVPLISTVILINVRNNSVIDEKYKNIFEKYLNIGICYTSQVYQMDKTQLIYNSVNVKEDRFFLIMHLVKCSLINNDKKSALNFLKEALSVYEEVVKYIEIYKNELIINEEIEYEKKQKEEFENYKIQVKSTIKSLIKDCKLEEATLIITEYQQLVPDDIETVLLKSEIALKII